MKLIFAGTPYFAVPALLALCEAGHEVACVLTQPDRPVGRGRHTQPPPVKQAAQQLGLPVLQPERLRDPHILTTLSTFNVDVMVVVAYGMILPAELLDQHRLGCLNIHASLLPAWRGAAPIQRALAAGDVYTGVTIMQMDATLDTGDILLTEALPILATDTAQTLHDQLSTLGASAIVTALTALEQGILTPRPQDHRLATYARKLEKSEAIIDWTLPATDLANRVRAFNPWPVAQSTLNGTPWRIWSATAIPPPATAYATASTAMAYATASAATANPTVSTTTAKPTATQAPAASTATKIAAPGTILTCSTNGLHVATGQGILSLTRLQRPGGKPLAIGQLLNARSFQPGDRFDTL